jgi:hypothetical protein
MQLLDIDKVRYRKHLNIIIVSFIVSLLVLSLAFGAILINLFSTVNDIPVAVQAANTATELVQGEEPTNFRYNLLGVILALLANAAVLHSVKSGDFFKEVYYVWQIKQIQNLIYRKLKKIKAAATQGDEKALIVLSYYFKSLKQVYQLDDNTITISNVEKESQKIDTLINEKGLTLSSDQFEKTLLANYA